MKELEELRARMGAERPASWEQLPDLALYMDQLISYMPRQLIHFEDGDVLTSAMVNNYIKDGLLPRAEGKRYGRTHLAYLTAICAMKQVMSMKEMAALLQVMDAGKDTEELYSAFLELLDGALNTAARELDTSLGSDDLVGLATSLALKSYANKLACQRVLSLVCQEKGVNTLEKKKK